MVALVGIALLRRDEVAIGGLATREFVRSAAPHPWLLPTRIGAFDGRG